MPTATTDAACTYSLYMDSILWHACVGSALHL